jgi:glycosyltransferase involved in cell wall biosynthesis
VTLYTNRRVHAEPEELAEWLGYTPHFIVERLPYLFFRRNVPVLTVLGELFFACAWLWHVRGQQFDVIYARSEWVLVLVGLVRGFTGLAWETHEGKYNGAVRVLLRNRVPVIAISRGVKEVYTSCAVDSSQVFVAHDGLDEKFFQPTEEKKSVRDRLGIDPDAFIALYIGGFDTWKGVETFCRAATFAPEITFVAIGGTPKQVTELASRFPSVQFLGSRPYAELPHNQQAADVLVIPNTARDPLSARFTSPLKLFAHLASGVPMVASDVPALRDVLNEEAAMLVTPDDPRALAEGIQNVRTTPKEAHLRAQQAHDLAQAYTWRARAKHILSFLDRLPSGNVPPSQAL